MTPSRSASVADGPADGLATIPETRGTGRRLRGAVAYRLGSAIVSGEHAPGEVLMSEADGSEALKVSRGAYREAIRTLVAKGLVESRPRSGTIVQPRHRWNLLDPDVLTWTFSGQPDMAIVRSLFELRIMVEPWAASMAAQRRTREDIKALRTALAAMARHGMDHLAGQAADCAFHDAILRATGNDYLVVLTTSIGTAVTMTTQFKRRSSTLPRDPIPEHRRVLDAIVAGDGAAASAAMRMLVDRALEDTRQAMG
ncbi:FadR/GntR family transcriptional regulator [Sphingomonas sp. Leaf343]|uniref:FadR/GntR family transcriptional regulator n=1 Tax=Sphingomonas sp. Leaf343 TaxID=1736345 RepID=UPI000700962F|nr:FadR/GntR family transcriptional regulator [Sphingomonas sp. Leaf343]KQR87391.1 GntR family transcriptional regulator [Sphingomonas sp. Leaf343]